MKVCNHPQNLGSWSRNKLRTRSKCSLRTGKSLKNDLKLVYAEIKPLRNDSKLVYAEVNPFRNDQKLVYAEVDYSTPK